MSTETDAIVENCHGTNTGYTYGCRCEPCKTAHSTYMRGYKRRNPQDNTSAHAKARAYFAQVSREERGLTDPDDPRHGTTTGYSKWGCRCDPCRAAAADYKRRWREAKQCERKQP